MNRQLPILVLLLVLGTTVASTPVAAVEDPRFETYVPEPTVTPGEANRVTVQFLNDADEVDDRVKTASAVKATMRGAETPFTVTSGTQLIGDLPDGHPVTAQFHLRVPRDVAAGTYAVPIRLTYEYDGDERETTTVSATVVVEERASFTIVNASSDLGIGDHGTVAVTIRNDGSEYATAASVRLQSQTTNVRFGSDASASSFVGHWAPNETKTVRVDATAPPSASVGTYAVAATVSYTDEDGLDRTSASLSDGVRVGPSRDRFALSNVSDTLRVGEEGKLSMTVSNTGEPARNVVVTLARTGTNVNPLETEYAIGDLAAGDSATVAFPIEVSGSAEPTPRQFTLDVAYETATGQTRTAPSQPIRAVIRPERDRFVVAPIDATVAAGSTETVTLEVTNNGGSTVSNVNAKLFANDPVSAPDDEAFVEALDPGETTNLTFTVGVAGGATAKTYPVSMDFQYDENGDSKLSKTYQLPVSVTTSESGDRRTTMIGVGVGAVVLIAGALVWYRRR